MPLTLLAGALLLVAALAPASARAELLAYAAGDIGECDGPAADSNAARTARLIAAGAPVLVLGDTTYPTAQRATIERCYTPTWGRFLASSYVVPGNHDYVHGTTRDFAAYFGARNPGYTWFRAPLGDWWVIGLDSNLDGSRLAQQQAWLEEQLHEIDGDGRCIVALWHHALFSTGLHSGDGARMRPAWRALDRAGADLALSGHEHFYESFEPRDADGRPALSGIREFVVGTGGAPMHDWSLSGGHRDYARTFGVLELRLAQDHYAWRFLGIDGTSRDAGAARCRRAPAAAPSGR